MAVATIRPDTKTSDSAGFMAKSGKLRAFGRTMGEALDALASQWGSITETVPVLIQHFGPDRFFTQAQFNRMEELRNHIETLTAEERTELESLIDAELDATISRLDAFASLPSHTGTE